VFELSVAQLTADRFSVPAALCLREPPAVHQVAPEDLDASAGPARSYYIDRDWWVFRHIYLFLRDGKLPSSVATLRELYFEAAFYRLSLLRYAIEAKIVDAQDKRRAQATAAHAAAAQAACAPPGRGQGGAAGGGGGHWRHAPPGGSNYASQLSEVLETARGGGGHSDYDGAHSALPLRDPFGFTAHR
jgi:hypothetical protein